MFKRNLKTKPSDEEEVAEERLELEATEITREEDRSAIGLLSFLARLDEVQKSLCTTPGVGVSVHIYVKVFSMAYIFQIT